MDRKITPEQQRQKDRLLAARKEIRAAAEEHSCFLISEGSLECWVCGKTYKNGQFISAIQVPVKEEKEAVPQPRKAPADRCLCIPDADGECVSCKLWVRDGVFKLVSLLERTVKDFKKIVGSPHPKQYCQVCNLRYMDWALSGGIRKILDFMGSWVVVNEIYCYLIQAVKSFGVEKLPLTEKVWADFCKEKDVK